MNETIKQIKEAQAKLNKAIQSATVQAMGEFKKETGLVPTSISIDLIKLYKLGDLASCETDAHVEVKSTIEIG